MTRPDRDNADQEPRPDSTPSSHNEPTVSQANGPTSSRVRVKPPKAPPVSGRSDSNSAPAEPGESTAFVRKGGPPKPKAGQDEQPRIDPELGLSWLGATDGRSEERRVGK